jgi:hypothetical protein
VQQIGYFLPKAMKLQAKGNLRMMIHKSSLDISQGKSGD